ncbi:MAG: prolipoprotein diacylglyceryl transferase [Isosphaeraceae bacterium]|nr:prolipoprotein diacylglyceryl transferase [Isosphaeraceae bacterium]
MRQILFEIPGTPIKLFGFGTMLMLAFIGSMWLAARRAKREKLDPELIYDLAIWLFLGGLFGARLFFIIQYWHRMDSIWEVFEIWKGGIVFYGSVIGAAIAFVIYQRLRRFPILAMLDVIAPSAALGIAFGRIGCFLNGCCWGDRCEGIPWAVTFPSRSSPWASQVDQGLIAITADRSLPIHPTQLYSALDGLLLLILLSARYPIRKRDGEIFGILLLAYPITRFLIEQLRNDEGAIYAGMTISQVISVLVFVLALIYWGYLLTTPARRWVDEADASTPAVEAATPA